MLLFLQALLTLPVQQPVNPLTKRILSDYKETLSMADKNEKLKRVNEINSEVAKDRKTGYCKMIARKDEFAKTVLRWTIVGIAACVFLIMFKLCSYVLSLN